MDNSEPETYENPLESLNSLTTVHERDQDRTSQPNRFKIKIPTIDNEAPPKILLSSISCAQQNTNA